MIVYTLNVHGLLQTQTAVKRNTFLPFRTEQTCSDHLNTFIFPEFELVTEPEEMPANDEKHDKAPEEKQSLELHPSDDGSGKSKSLSFVEKNPQYCEMALL